MNSEYSIPRNNGERKDARSERTVFRPTSRKDVALWYAEQFGWTCLPAQGKRPILPWRDEVMPELPPLETLADLWEPTPNANIAVLTGHRSGLGVADVDPRSAGKLETLWDLGWPPETPIAKSGGGGWHVYVACPAEGLASMSGYAQGIELKADGALVIAPPSVHPDGPRYEWLAGCEPWHVPLATLPQSVLDTLAARSPQQRSTPKAPALDPDDPRRLVYSQEETLRLTTTLVNWALRKVQAGDHRNNVAYLLGQQLDSLGLTRHEIAAVAALYERLVRHV